MTPEQLISDISEKWGEHIEMADDKSAITCRILANLLIQERQKSDYFEKRTKNYEKYYNVSI